MTIVKCVQGQKEFKESDKHKHQDMRNKVKIEFNKKFISLKT